MQVLTKNLGRVDIDSFKSARQAILPIEMRIKSRAKITLDNGQNAGFILPRGGLIRGGDVLASDDGDKVLVLAASEMVSTIEAKDSFSLMRAAYHLGNRHVPLELSAYYVRYAHDNVLDEMIRGMGLDVTVDFHPFEPEAGAYQQTGHHHHG
ncbi:MAG: urease accessory protein UreE [Cellvibrionales bacterium]|nr:urease accessory protein UreE [Cellvibrionales bacterium]